MCVRVLLKINYRAQNGLSQVIFRPTLAYDHAGKSNLVGHILLYISNDSLSYFDYNVIYKICCTVVLLRVSLCVSVVSLYICFCLSVCVLSLGKKRPGRRTRNINFVWPNGNDF